MVGTGVLSGVDRRPIGSLSIGLRFGFYFS